MQLPPDATLEAVERQVTAALRTASRRFNQKRPEIIVYPHEHDPRCVAAVTKLTLLHGTATANLAPRALRMPLNC